MMPMIDIAVSVHTQEQRQRKACVALLSCSVHGVAEELANPDLAYGVQCCRYLGLYKDEIGAAIACDKEAVRCRGIDAVTHFDLADYKELLGMLSKSKFALLLWPVVH